MQDWKIVQGSQAEMPLELDTTSSDFFVYQRRNIERMIAEDLDGKIYEFWQYEERKLTKEEYAAIHVAELEDELTQTQLALIELYEALI